MKAIIIPGNNGSSPRDIWFPDVEKKLQDLGLTVINTQFPDMRLARREYWLPLLTALGADEQTILIGYSSGAAAALRFAEKNKILGSVLIAAHYTDLGLSIEKQSHYFSEPWDWETIKNNQQWIVQFASSNDPLVPAKEAKYIQEKLSTVFYEIPNQGHFFGNFFQPKRTFPELISVLKNIIATANQKDTN